MFIIWYVYRVKTKLKTMRGVRRESLPCYLDEFMWREHYGKTSSEAFYNILEHISQKHRTLCHNQQVIY